MKISLLQENLNKGLATVSRSVSSKATLPILSNILLITDKGGLRLSATNLETGLNFWLGAKIEEEGAICIPAKFLTEFVASLPSQKVDLETKENSLMISCQGFKATFTGMSPNEFPQIPKANSDSAITFEKNEFLKAINQVVFSASTDEGRPALTGVLLKPQGDKVSLVATDGYRLSVKTLSANLKITSPIIIPAKTLIEISRIISDSEDIKEVVLSLAENESQVIFSFPQIELASRLIEGDFPNFEKIIPEKFEIKSSFDREELLRAVKIASVFAREQANIVKLTFADNKIKVSAETTQMGSSEMEIIAKTSSGSLEIAFNYRFLLDFLNATSGEEILFEALGALNPGSFKVSGDSSFFHIIMPVRIQT